ncbi:MAG TPA: CsgG/HfaB family protein [bacterium]|nr:CsgG/HfaB family protein [bacterium]
MIEFQETMTVKRSLVVLAAAAVLSGCGHLLSREYLAPDASRHAVKSAAVLPLENLTGVQDAGKIVADTLSTELSTRKVDVVDRGRAEAQLARMDVVTGGSVDRLTAQRVGEILGVDAVVYGSVAEAGDGSADPGPKHADVGLTVRVLEVKTGKFLLAGSYTAEAGKDSITGAARVAADRIAEAVGK